VVIYGSAPEKVCAGLTELNLTRGQLDSSREVAGALKTIRVLLVCYQSGNIAINFSFEMINTVLNRGSITGFAEQQEQLRSTLNHSG
jgi:hypothetical protein